VPCNNLFSDDVIQIAASIIHNNNNDFNPLTELFIFYLNLVLRLYISVLNKLNCRHSGFIQSASSLVYPSFWWCWKASKLRTFDTQADVIEVNHWAKVANKTTNINAQNRSLYAS